MVPKGVRPFACYGIDSTDLKSGVNHYFQRNSRFKSGTRFAIAQSMPT